MALDGYSRSGVDPMALGGDSLRGVVACLGYVGVDGVSIEGTSSRSISLGGGRSLSSRSTSAWRVLTLLSSNNRSALRSSSFADATDMSVQRDNAAER